MIGVEPAEVEVAALARLAYRDHLLPSFYDLALRSVLAAHASLSRPRAFRRAHDNCQTTVFVVALFYGPAMSLSH